MNVSAALRAELVGLVAARRGRARVTIAGTSMEPLLRAGMVIDVEPLDGDPRIGDILVFLAATRLVAHRLVGGERLSTASGVAGARLLPGTTHFVTAGDAYPNREEIVPAGAVIGRVAAVWSDARPGARRLDDARFRLRGTLMARTRRVRSLLGRLRTIRSLFVGGARPGGARALRALRAAGHEFENGNFAAGVDLLAGIAVSEAFAVARRHNAAGLVAQWLEAAARHGVEAPADLRATFARARWVNALQAGRVLACVREVRDCFARAGIAHIFLKGGARLGAGDPDADFLFSGDVDVLVPADQADAAVSVLRAAEFTDLRPASEHAVYARRNNHRAPLRAPGNDVLVEVHTALAVPALVSRQLGYEALAHRTRLVDGPVGTVQVLDDETAALHLAYHGRDFRSWRDIVLLARKLRAFDAAARARFDADVRAERRDALRLAAAVSAADALAFGTTSPTRAIRRFSAWVDVREDLPPRLGKAEIVEALAGRCRQPALTLAGPHDIGRWLRIWIANIILLPPVGALLLARRFERHARDSAAAKRRA